MRGKSAQIRQVLPDYKYGNVLVSKLVNYVMKDGKKTTAERIVYDAFEIMAKKTKKEAIDVFDEAMKNVMPSVEIRSRRVGGANYQIPVPVRSERRVALAYRWILESARSKKGKPMAQKLANELILASQGEGDAVKKKMEVQRMAEANKAFAHFARR
ncbi:30S ribosomal protein S7 [Patescibacteria group bacterium]|nr:30S ribosomal protein S7 [Patescibacteria group bacterium]MBU4452867.1 30S ribosomal protein S7 [Patescibacteria group bacterium]MCG2687571.1 30S ribosomal protein S7 [Candidatus Parcubacteria bacterium]